MVKMLITNYIKLFFVLKIFVSLFYKSTGEFSPSQFKNFLNFLNYGNYFSSKRG